MASISICIPVKNRASNLRRCVESIEACDDVDEIVVADFWSTDTDYEWFDHTLVRVDGPFSIGAGKNRAAEHSTGSILFFLDADMVVPQRCIDRARAVVEDDRVFAPMCWFWLDPEHREGRWNEHGFGLLAISRQRFFDNDPWPEWHSYGGEDNVFVYQHQELLVRENVEGFEHAWHPHELRSKHYLKPAGEDLDQWIDNQKKS